MFTLFFISSELSAFPSYSKFLYFTGVTSTCISILSSKGPLILPIYLEIAFEEHVHSFSSEPKNPHGHGFIDATNIKLQAYVILAFTLLIVTILSSNGPLNTSSVFLLNSGNSSKNNTPLWAKLISPGLGILPPPINELPEIVWWGALKGLVVIKATSLSVLPATLCIFVVSKASSKLKSGNIVGILLAIIVFPDPGVPIRRQLCPPADAISNALFIFSCPLTSEKSNW